MKSFSGTLIEGSVVRENKEKADKAGLINSNLVWTTDRLEKTKRNLEKGKFLTGPNPFFENKNLELKKDNLIYEYTQHELDELVKCEQDILYFAEKYCRIKKEDGQYGHFELRPYQKKALRAFQNNRFVIYCASRQIGKCLIFQSLTKINGEEKSVGMLFNENKKRSILSTIKEMLYSLYNIL